MLTGVGLTLWSFCLCLLNRWNLVGMGVLLPFCSSGLKLCSSSSCIPSSLDHRCVTLFFPIPVSWNVFPIFSCNSFKVLGFDRFWIFFFYGTGLELRVYTLSHTSPFLVMDVFKIESHKLFALAGFKPQSSWSLLLSCKNCRYEPPKPSLKWFLYRDKDLCSVFYMWITRSPLTTLEEVVISPIHVFGTRIRLFLCDLISEFSI
jgi:hypothetical protein